jgi:predicted DNA-binding ribbon-helix-helix protein
MLKEVWKTRFDYMGTETDVQYIVFGSVLIPALEEALSARDLSSILPVCAFLEDVAEAARKDSYLESLLRIEVGEWLGGAANESLLTPWLGSETKRICRYVPGLATQRRELQEKQEKRSLASRLSAFLKQFRKN